jgi:hypothetical protein
MKSRELKVSRNYTVGAFIIALIAMVLNIETGRSQFAGQAIKEPLWHS